MHRLIKLSLSIAFMALSISCNPSFAQDNSEPLEPPTELEAIEVENGIHIKFKGPPGVLNYSIYHDGKYAGHISYQDSEMDYKQHIDKKATNKTRISLVSITGNDKDGTTRFSRQSAFVIPRIMPELVEGKAPLGIIANTVESLITLGSIGLGASAGDYVCVTARISVNNEIALPNANFCFEIDKAY